MAFSLLRRWWRFGSPPGAPPLVQPRLRGLRSDAALEAIAEAISNRTPNVALYNYPSLSGAFSALFAHLFHFRMGLPCLFLPFSSVVPFRIDDLCFEGLKKCYFLDFIGAQGFAAELSRRTCCEVLCFDHRKSSVAKILYPKEGVGRLTFYFDDEKSSSVAAYEYFLSKDGANSLLNDEDCDRVELILKYLEDGDLRQRRLPDIWAFNIGVGEWRSKMNCITNPHMFDQLLALSAEEMIAKGKAYMSSRMDTAKGLLKKVFKLRLGRGFYGECLGVRADSNPDLSDEIAKELSLRSAASGLRPIGAVIYMQRNNLKMCLRSTDTATDTSEIAKAYGGGGSPSSSSFIIRMDEYNRWLSM